MIFFVKRSYQSMNALTIKFKEKNLIRLTIDIGIRYRVNIILTNKKSHQYFGRILTSEADEKSISKKQLHNHLKPDITQANFYTFYFASFCFNHKHSKILTHSAKQLAIH